MKFYKSTLALAVCSLLAACGSDSGNSSTSAADDNDNSTTPASALTIHMLGDSTMTTYAETDERPRKGWGQKIPMFFDDNTEINNWAAGGRSSLSFYYEESKWPAIKPQLAEGDYVIIQFAHNDQKKDDAYAEYGTYAYCDDGSTTAAQAEGCANADHSYYLNLKKYVVEAREAGAIPVLVSPIVRAYFDDSAISQKGQHNLTDPIEGETYARGNYVEAMQAVAAEYSVPYVDLTDATKAIVEGYGSVDTFTYLLPEDSTHPNELFATLIAKAAADGIIGNSDLSELHSHIVAASSVIANPSSLEWGEQYTGLEKVKSLSVSAFDLEPAEGTITLTAPTGFQLASTSDADTWNSNYSISYNNGAFTEKLLAQFSPTAEQEYTGSINVDSSSATLAKIDVSGTGVAAPAGAPSESSWFTAGRDDLTGQTDGLIAASEVVVSDGLTRGFGSNGTASVEGTETTVARIYADHDYSSDKYLEFTVTANSEVFNVTDISAYLATSGTSNVSANIAYSLSADFSNPVELASELSLPRDSDAGLQQFAYPVTEEVAVGKSIYVRIYPWMKSASSGGRYLALYDVSIDGVSGE